MCLLVGVLWGAGVRTFGASAGEVTRRYVVQPGDTVWAIAVRSEPAGADPRPLVDQIQTLNDLQDGRLQPGQTLIVPAG